ncbi:MAG: FkbM family methyltransferase [Tannerella sp.]|jgi:FkbM family methyltransferase|nr:FkbM family methyltransferase [Tannerella sp.]
MKKTLFSGAVRKYLKDMLVSAGHRKLWTKHTYSEDGEDGVLRAFYEDRPAYRGFYVDIGAYHPVHLSNTHWFYERGWRGINIDATPGSMNAFRRVRRRDVNIETGVSDSYGELEFLFYGETSTLNRLGAETSAPPTNEGEGRKIKIQTQPVNDLLRTHLPAGQHIDFITMDVEGCELKILQSMDFGNYAPDFFLVEELDYVNRDFMSYHASPVYILLRERGYRVVAKTKRTVIFRKD